MTNNKLIICDPGHGGTDPGATNGGLYEKAATLAIGKMLREELEARGYAVKMTRDTDKTLTLAERCRISNEAGAALFVSIHCNSASNAEAHGIETFHATTCSATAKEAAARVQARMVDATGARDRGVKSAAYYVLKHTKAPAILVETGFISSETEKKKLFKSSYQRALAEAIAAGIADTLG